MGACCSCVRKAEHEEIVGAKDQALRTALAAKEQELRTALAAKDQELRTALAVKEQELRTALAAKDQELRTTLAAKDQEQSALRIDLNAAEQHAASQAERADSAKKQLEKVDTMVTPHTGTREVQGTRVDGSGARRALFDDANDIDLELDPNDTATVRKVVRLVELQTSAAQALDTAAIDGTEARNEAKTAKIKNVAAKWRRIAATSTKEGAQQLARDAEVERDVAITERDAAVRAKETAEKALEDEKQKPPKTVPGPVVIKEVPGPTIMLQRVEALQCEVKSLQATIAGLNDQSKSTIFGLRQQVMTHEATITRLNEEIARLTRPPTPPPQPPSNFTFNGDPCVGINSSGGQASGRLVFQGPRGGLYMIDHAGRPTASSRRVSTRVDQVQPLV